MAFNWAQDLIAGSAGAAAAAVAVRRRTAAETESIAVSTLRGVLEELRAELDRKQEEINLQHDAHEREIDTMKGKVATLERNLTVLADPTGAA